MKVAAGLDTGDMLLKGEVAITPDTTGEILHDKLAVLGGQLVLQTLRQWNDIIPQPQDDALSCYAAKIEKDESLLDFSLPAQKLCRKIMAFSPYPAVYFEHDGERFKVLSAKMADEKIEEGTICQKGNRLFIGAKGGGVEIEKIQRQGKKPMLTAELLRGYNF